MTNSNNKRESIMIADNYATNLRTYCYALSGEYMLVTAPSVASMLKIVSERPPSLVILSDNMPGMDGLEPVRRIRSDERTRDIPVLVITGRLDADKEQLGRVCGVNEFALKPVAEGELLFKARRLIERTRKPGVHIPDEQIRHARMDAVGDAIVEIIAELVENRDDLTGKHIDRTMMYFRVLINAVVSAGVYAEETSKWDVPILINAVQLHDIGKSVIPDSILLKPGKLTTEEFDIVKLHTTNGAKILEKIENRVGKSEFLTHAKLIAATHHEKWNGRGYPHGLSGTDIPLQGRLMAIVDVYDAFTSERPYRKAFRHEEAVRLIRENSASHFDPKIAAVFLDIESEFPAVLAESGLAPELVK